MPADERATLREMAERIASVFFYECREYEWLSRKIEQEFLTYAAAQRSDYDNDMAHLRALKEGSRALRALFAKHGIDGGLDWPEWFAAVERHVARFPSREALKEADRLAREHDIALANEVIADIRRYGGETGSAECVRNRLVIRASITTDEGE